MKVTYDKDTRKLAKSKGHGLFTIDYEGGGFPKMTLAASVLWRGGVTMQGPMSPSKARQILAFIKKLKEQP